jgi:hypothetical protein
MLLAPRYDLVRSTRSAQGYDRLVSSDGNKHGLSRNIPEWIKRQVRQHCGFGCAFCGIALAEFHHVDPAFIDATTHDPSRIAYVCGRHHAACTRGTISVASVKEAVASPWCVRQRRCHEAFDIGGASFRTWIGTLCFLNAPFTLDVGGEPLLRLEQPELDGGPYRLSGVFRGREGETLLEIRENEWCHKGTAWDVKTVGRRIIILSGESDIALQLLCAPREGLVVEKLHMTVGTADCIVDGDQFHVSNGADLSFAGVSVEGLGPQGCALIVGDGRVNLGYAPFRVLVGNMPSPPG